MPKEKPPVFPSWWMWYALVAGFLVALIFLFYSFTKTFS